MCGDIHPAGGGTLKNQPNARDSLSNRLIVDTRCSHAAIACTVSGPLLAQLKTGNNPTTIGNGQLLELEKSGQRGGLKPAEVALTSSTDNTTISISLGAVRTLV